MQDSFKRIIERRRTQILDQVLWTRDVAAAFERYDILNNDELRTIEMDHNVRNRMFTAISKLIAHDGPGVFERFRQLLIECGYEEMADSLKFDRSRIQWDFEKQPHATSLSNYIDHVNADLLQASCLEQDDYIRQCMVLAAKQRLVDLRNSLRQQQIDRDNFRTKIFDLVCPLGKRISFNSVSYQVKDSVTLSELEDVECSKDEMIFREADGFIEALGAKTRGLENEVKRLQSLLVENDITTYSSSLALSDQPLKNDEQHERSDEISANENEFNSKIILQIDKSELHELMKSLKCSTSFKTNSVILPSDSIQQEDYSAENLSALLRTASKEMDDCRNRCLHLNERVEQLELERLKIANELSGIIVNDRSNRMSRKLDTITTFKLSPRSGEYFSGRSKTNLISPEVVNYKSPKNSISASNDDSSRGELRLNVLKRGASTQASSKTSFKISTSSVSFSPAACHKLKTGVQEQSSRVRLAVQTLGY